MTWGVDPETEEVWEDDPEFAGIVLTIDLSDEWTYPDDIKSIMRETWEEQASIGNSPVMDVRAGHILIDLATDNIVRGPVPTQS